MGNLFGNMHVSAIGAIAGFGVGFVMVLFEYLMLKRIAERRAVQKGKKKPELDPTERVQLASTFRFALFLPPGFALLAWMFWG